MSAWVYSVSGQTEGRRKTFLEWRSNDKQSLTILVEIMLTIIKVFINLFLLCLWKKRTPKKFSKQISGLSFQLSFQVCSLFGQNEGEWKAFFRDCKKGAHVVKLTPRALGCHERWKVSPFVKFEIILPLLCFLLDHLTNKHCRALSSMINLWKDSRTCRK